MAVAAVVVVVSVAVECSAVITSEECGCHPEIYPHPNYGHGESIDATAGAVVVVVAVVLEGPVCHHLQRVWPSP